MALPVEEVLGLWRELERAEFSLPPRAPQRRIIRKEIVDLRRLYRSLTSESHTSRERLEMSHVTIDAAKSLLRALHDDRGS